MSKKQQPVNLKLKNLLETALNRSTVPLPFFVPPGTEWQYFIELHETIQPLVQHQAAAASGTTSASSAATAASGVSNGAAAAPGSPEKVKKGKINVYNKWLVDRGAKLNGIEVKSGFKEGNGVVAVEDIKKGDVMIEVPQSLMITEELALNSRRVLSVLQSCSSLFQNNGDQISSCALMLWLLEQKFNPSSEWKPYIDTLPEYYALPYYFSPEELSELKGTTAGSDLIRRYRDLIRYYTNFYKAIETDNIPLVPLHKFTFERFRWAFCTVLARQNQIRRLVNAKKDGKDVKREKWVMCLIPGFDNFNHADAELSNEFDESTGSLKVMASSDYKKGQQVYNSYTNSRSNAERLICSGFVAQRLNLPHDSFKIYLNVTGKTPLNFKPMAGLSKEDKELIAKRVKLLKEKFECDEQNVLPFSSPLKTQSKGLLVYLIANFATAEDLDRLEKELINMDSAKTDEKKEEKKEGEEKETEDSKSSKKRSKSASPSRKPKDEKATPKTPQEILDSNITTLTNLLVGSELSAKSTESVVNWLKTKLLVLERSLGEGTIEDLEGKAKKVKSEIGVLKGSGEVQAGDKDKEREILKLIWRKNVLGYKVTEKRLVGALKKEVEKLEKEIEAKKA